MSAPQTIPFSYENDDGDEITVDFPTRWEICGDCQGEGTTYLGWAAADQPAFTREDFEDEGPDFMEEYIGGVYDKECPTCDGTGKVREIDEDVAESKYPVAFKAYLDDCKSEADYRAMVRAEQRFGC